MLAKAIAVGSFDMIHVGHLTALRAAAERTRHLIVAVADDAAVEERLGRPPAVTTDERVELLEAFFPECEVVVVDDVSGSALLGRFGEVPRFLAVSAGAAPDVTSGTWPGDVVVVEFEQTSSESLGATVELEVLWPPG